jgi:nicotinate-nucleotide adenylyltransferase
VRPPRLGWLGGSFDPVHEGHLAAARAVADALDLDVVLLVPAARPPHKPERVLAPCEDRLALLRIACAGDRRLVASDVELRRPGPSYSVDTAEALLAGAPAGTRLHLIVGSDMLADLPRWHRAAALLALVTICPVAREGVALEPSALAPLVGAAEAAAIRARAVRTPVHPASSSGVREALLAGREARWLPPGVAEEIARRGLYGAGGGSRSDSSGTERSIP